MDVGTVLGVIVAIAVIAFIVYRIRGAGGGKLGTRRDGDDKQQRR